MNHNLLLAIAIVAICGGASMAQAEEFACQDCHSDHLGRPFAHFPAENDKTVSPLERQFVIEPSIAPVPDEANVSTGCLVKKTF